MSRRARPLRLLLFGAAGVAAGVLIVSIAAAQSGRQPGRHTVTKKPQPTCEEAIREAGRQNDKVNCTHALMPAGGTPGRHGPYRIVPAGFTGDLTANELPLPANIGERTNDLAALKKSSLYAEPGYVPAGYQLAKGDTFDATSELVVHLTYDGPRGPIDIYRTRQTKDVVDVYEPPPSGDVELRRTTIKGATAVILAPKPGTFAEKINSVTVQLLKNGVNTTIKTRGFGLQETMKIAESIP